MKIDLKDTKNYRHSKALEHLPVGGVSIVLTKKLPKKLQNFYMVIQVLDSTSIVTISVGEQTLIIVV